jgi:hypothetical protein
VRLVLDDRLPPGPVVDRELELECGHRVDLGLDSPPAVAAVCVLRHWERCGETSSVGQDRTGGTLPVTSSPGALAR